MLLNFGWTPLLMCAGSGSIHNSRPGREAFADTTEAEVFANIAREMGVPDSVILIENTSQNTGQNYEFGAKILADRNILLDSVIAVQKPYMERRTYATGKMWWPDIDLIVSSPPISMEDYPNESNNHGEQWIHGMVGDLQRIKQYPALGFQIFQEIPDEVWEAYKYLVKVGYSNRLLK